MRNLLLTLTALMLITGPAFAGSYEVEGYDENSNYVYGEVDSDSNGNVDGYVYDEYGNEHAIEGEFNGAYGSIEATDDEGNSLNLDAD